MQPLPPVAEGAWGPPPASAPAARCARGPNPACHSRDELDVRVTEADSLGLRRLRQPVAAFGSCGPTRGEGRTSLRQRRARFRRFGASLEGLPKTTDVHLWGRA